MEVNKQEQRSYIKIAVLRGRNARQSHAELREALGVHAMPYRTVARWVETFKRFANKEDIVTAFRREVSHGSDTHAANGIQHLPHRWQRTVDTLGDYFEGL